MSNSEIDFMSKAWKMAEKCTSQYKFGAVIAKGDRLISADRNHTSETPDASAHAEVSAIRKACLELDDISLGGCTLYATHEPCIMCFACAMWAGVEKVVYEVPKSEQEEFMYESSLELEEFNKLALRTKMVIERYMRKTDPQKLV